MGVVGICSSPETYGKGIEGTLRPSVPPDHNSPNVNQLVSPP